jgi:transposase-like protein
VLPPAVAGININHCKNHLCANFGVPAEIVRWRRLSGTPLALRPGTAYMLVPGKNKLLPKLKCLLCGEHFIVKSNLAAAEELARLAAYLRIKPAAGCTTAGCTNEGVPVGDNASYQRFGKTAAGTPRYRCRACKKTVAVGGRALKRQRVTHRNKDVLLGLTNKVAMRRICKMNGLAPPTLYRKIAFLHRQCVAYAAARERALQNLDIPRLYLSSDRQDYMVNWSKSGDQRNTILKALGTADNDTGYVFAMSLAFDSSVNPSDIEADALACNDDAHKKPYRKYARLWLRHEYRDSTEEREAEDTARSRRSKRSVADEVAAQYEAQASREDTEVADQLSGDERIADRSGMAVHEVYTMYGHFLLLRRLLPKVEKFRFYLDQESGIRASFMAAFHDLVKVGRADAFYVRIAKEQVVGKKRKLVANAAKALGAFMAAHPHLDLNGAKREMMKASITASVELGTWKDAWCAHPAPTMREPAKAACWLTNRGTYDLDHQANLYLRATLSGIDGFFQRLRRSVNPLERPLRTSSTSYRTWYGYAPYNPRMVERFIDIYRVMHNFVEIGKDGKTPAMRLGLAAAPIQPEEIIYFENAGATIKPPKRRRPASRGRKLGSGVADPPG